jgi:small-conductance mechanosensitive channel
MLMDKLSILFNRAKLRREESRKLQEKIASSPVSDAEQKLEVHIEVDYGNDFKKTEMIALHSAEEMVLRKSEGIIGSEQHWHFHSFGKNSVFFTIVVYLKKGANRAAARSVFSKHLESHFSKNRVVHRISVDY